MMNLPTFTTTDIQRRFPKILDRLTDAFVVIRDSQPAAVVVDYNEYLRMKRIEEKDRAEAIEQMLRTMHDKNARFPAPVVKKDVDEALSAVRSRR